MLKNMFLIATAFILLSTSKLEAQKIPDIAFNPSIQYNIPFGTFGDIYGSGLGIQAGLEMSLINNLSIGAQVSYLFWTPVAENNQLDIVYYNIPLEVYLLYYFEEAGGFRPYAGLELGYNMLTYSEELVATKYINRYKDNQLGYSPVFGLITGFSEGLLLDANIKYTTILSGDGNNNTGKENILFFSFNIGLLIEV